MRYTSSSVSAGICGAMAIGSRDGVARDPPTVERDRNAEKFPPRVNWLTRFSCRVRHLSGACGLAPRHLRRGGIMSRTDLWRLSATRVEVDHRSREARL